MPVTTLILGVGAAVAGLALGLFIIPQKKLNEQEAAKNADRAMSDAKKESQHILERAKASVEDRKKTFEIEQKEYGTQIEQLEKSFQQKQGILQKREAKIQELERDIKAEEQTIERAQTEMKQYQMGIVKKLSDRLGISLENVKGEVFQQYDRMFSEDAELRFQHKLEWIQESAVRTAKNQLAEAVYKYSASTVDEQISDEVHVPRDDMKGRVIGRGGRMIAFFEELFGVDVVFNDEPNVIRVSCFNLVQQEIARRALERLLKEKVINEEIMKQVKLWAENDVSKKLEDVGRRALKILGVENMPLDFIKLVGRLKYRTSYGQNVLLHCLEVGYFAKLLASELGADETVAWHAGFFHDIGKAIDQETGGSHDVLSKEILEKYGFSREITHAAWAHHNAIPIETVEAFVVQAADAISASRPGARAESMERYLTKIKDLEEAALSFSGTKKAFAINAGREVRVIMDSERVTDARTQEVAEGIAAKVQEKGGYPGKIKITTIRTTKATGYAK